MAAGRVLVVDDEQDHCTTLQAILVRGGISVVGAASAAQALAAVRRERFDVAMIDLRLPDSDGLTTMQALQEIQPWLRVVILTAYPTSRTCRTALTAGAVAYLEKPFGPESLLALVSALLEPDAEPPAA